jgi:hypothetical protein
MAGVRRATQSPRPRSIDQPSQVCPTDADAGLRPPSCTTKRARQSRRPESPQFQDCRRGCRSSERTRWRYAMRARPPRRRRLLQRRTESPPSSSRAVRILALRSTGYSALEWKSSPAEFRAPISKERADFAFITSKVRRRHQTQTSRLFYATTQCGWASIAPLVATATMRGLVHLEFVKKAHSGRTYVRYRV